MDGDVKVMATDIVIQLRELASSMERGNGKSTLYGVADEIERLPLELQSYKDHNKEVSKI